METLLSAVELGIFTAPADGGRDRESLASEVGLHPRSSADVFLEMANARLFGFWDNLTDALRTGAPFFATLNGVSTPLAAVPAAVLRSHPDITGAVFELPPVGPVFEEFVAAHGPTGRLTFHGGDFFSDPLPEADVHVMGQILHDWNLEQRRFLLKKAYDAMIDDDRRQKHATEWLRAAGFAEVEARPLVGGHTAAHATK
ncbi:methyltransferase [Streptomyces sp. NPDC007901]|uniref:methyltransferase n=1 Tax=Streptomyces sp. NPDC007901 TaxID=3364785 RepID=UPI0036EE0F3D